MAKSKTPPANEKLGRFLVKARAIAASPPQRSPTYQEGWDALVKAGAIAAQRSPTYEDGWAALVKPRVLVSPPLRRDRLTEAVSALREAGHAVTSDERDIIRGPALVSTAGSIATMARIVNVVRADQDARDRSWKARWEKWVQDQSATGNYGEPLPAGADAEAWFRQLAPKKRDKLKAAWVRAQQQPEWVKLRPSPIARAAANLIEATANSRQAYSERRNAPHAWDNVADRAHIELGRAQAIFDAARLGMADEFGDAGSELAQQRAAGKSSGSHNQGWPIRATDDFLSSAQGKQYLSAKTHRGRKDALECWCENNEKQPAYSLANFHSLLEAIQAELKARSELGSKHPQQ